MHEPDLLVDYLKERVAMVDAALNEYLPAADRLPAALHESMRYSVLPVEKNPTCSGSGGLWMQLGAYVTGPSRRLRHRNDPQLLLDS